jgi:hypothetical protein
MRLTDNSIKAPGRHVCGPYSRLVCPVVHQCNNSPAVKSKRKKKKKERKKEKERRRRRKKKEPYMPPIDWRLVISFHFPLDFDCHPKVFPLILNRHACCSRPPSEMVVGVYWAWTCLTRRQTDRLDFSRYDEPIRSKISQQLIGFRVH